MDDWESAADALGLSVTRRGKHAPSHMGGRIGGRPVAVDYVSGETGRGTLHRVTLPGGPWDHHRIWVGAWDPTSRQCGTYVPIDDDFEDHVMLRVRSLRGRADARRWAETFFDEGRREALLVLHAEVPDAFLETGVPRMSRYGVGVMRKAPSYVEYADAGVRSRGDTIVTAVRAMVRCVQALVGED